MRNPNPAVAELEHPLEVIGYQVAWCTFIVTYWTDGWTVLLFKESYGLKNKSCSSVCSAHWSRATRHSSIRPNCDRRSVQAAEESGFIDRFMSDDDMHRFIFLLLDLHPVGQLRYVSNNLRSNQQAAQSTLKTWMYMSYVLCTLILVQITCTLPVLDVCHWTTSGSMHRTLRTVQVQWRTWKEQIDFQLHYLGVLVRLWEAWFSTILVWFACLHGL